MIKLEKRSLLIYGGVLATGAIFLMVIAAVISAGNAAVPDDAATAYDMMGGIILLATILTILAMISKWYEKYRDLGVRNFATDNGFQCMAITDTHAWQGAIFTHDNSRLWPLIAGTYANQHFWLGNYCYRASNSSNKQEETQGVIRIELPRNLPNVVLDSNANNIFGRYISNLPTIYAGYQRYELEGDFNDYFTVYAPKGYERDMLYFLTPELMAAFVDFGANFDIEIIDDYLYLYSALPFGFTPEALQLLFNIIAKLGLETTDNTKRYQDDHIAPNTDGIQQTLVAAPLATMLIPEKGAVLPTGRRLKHGVNLLAVIVIIWVLLQFLPFIIQVIKTMFGIN